jgi:hypothetical protein
MLSVEGYAAFWQTLQLPSLGLMNFSWVLLEALYRAGGR